MCMTDELQVATTDDKAVMAVSLPPTSIDLLDEAQVAPMDLMSDYWSPDKVGESKRVIFDGIETMAVADQTTGEVMQLDCAFFWTKDERTGDLKRIRNASKRLVGAFLAVRKGAPFIIRYLGKAPNRTNSFKSDAWSVNPLVITVTPPTHAA